MRKANVTAGLIAVSLAGSAAASTIPVTFIDFQNEPDGVSSGQFFANDILVEIGGDNWASTDEGFFDLEAGTLGGRSGGQIDDPLVGATTIDFSAGAVIDSVGRITLSASELIDFGGDRIAGDGELQFTVNYSVVLELPEDAVLSITASGDDVVEFFIEPLGNGASVDGSFYTAGTYVLDQFVGADIGDASLPGSERNLFGEVVLEFTVIPLPPAAMIGLVGVGLVAWRRRDWAGPVADR